MPIFPLSSGERDRLIRNIARRRTTDNRYVTDINSFWREELHARIAHLDELIPLVLRLVNERITNNIWGFPVDEQSVSNTEEVFRYIVLDYFAFVAGRRVWNYTEVDGYWTEENITNTIAYAFIMALWDIGSQLLIDNYPLVEDDLRHRTGRTHSHDRRNTYHDSLNKTNTADSRESYHDSLNKTNTADSRETYHDSLNTLSTDDEKFTQQDNTRNKISEENSGSGSDTVNSRSTSNTTNVNDMFQSPQDQGVLPSRQSADLMNRTNDFQDPSNMGVEELSPNGNPAFTTVTQNNFEGNTDTNSEGRTSTTRDSHNRVDERDYLESNNTVRSGIEGQNNVGAKSGNTSYIEGENNVGGKTGNTSLIEGHNNVGGNAENNTGHERDEVLDISGVLQNFYDLFGERLMMEIDNRMLPYFLNMKIARFTDHRIGRKEYV